MAAATAVAGAIGPSSGSSIGASTGPAIGAPAPQPRVLVVLLLHLAERARWWGWSRIVIGRQGLRTVEGLRFFKVLGSGFDGGFGLRPSAWHQGLFCAFDDDADADRFLSDSDVVAAYRSHARELFSVKLRAYASRGSWAGQALPVSVEAPASGPVAVLTRASIRPARAAAFWRKAPGTQQSLEGAAGCQLAMGLGEAPLLRQATFSLWDDAASVDAYARQGAHQAAARAAYAEGYFSESMFVRFVPYAAQGHWKGRAFGRTD